MPDGVPVAYLTRYFTPVAGQVDLVPSDVLLVRKNRSRGFQRWSSTWSCWDKFASLNTTANVVMVPDLLKNAARASQCWDESMGSREGVLDLG